MRKKGEKYASAAEIEQAEILSELSDGDNAVNNDGKILYEFSSARTEYDFSDITKKSIIKSPQSIYLMSVDFLLLAWVVFSLAYRLATEDDNGAVFLSMLPSLIFVAAATCIVIISVLGAWGKVGRFALKHGMYSHGDAADTARLDALKSEFERADRNKNNENAITVTEHYVEITLCGRRRTYERNSVDLRVRRYNGKLLLCFTVSGEYMQYIDFPEPMPMEEFYKLKKAFGKRLTTVRDLPHASEKERDQNGKRLYGGYTAANIVISAFFSCVVLTAGIMLVVAHYLWNLPVPPFLGVFFALMSLLCFGNTFHHIPAVNIVMIPLAFALVLIVVPPWIFVWYETELAGNALTFFGVLTHADVFPVGMMFFTAIGGMVAVFGITKLVDYLRFGKNP